MQHSERQVHHQVSFKATYHDLSITPCLQFSSTNCYFYLPQVENGRDKFAKAKARGGVCQDLRSFYLCTGGGGGDQGEEEECENYTKYSVLGTPAYLRSEKHSLRWE